WPDNVRWSKHQRLWVGALVLSKVWVRGRLPDPCRGRAEHFGYEGDKPKPKMFKVDCGATQNIFYGLEGQGENRGNEKGTEAEAEDRRRRRDNREQIAREQQDGREADGRWWKHNACAYRH
ncbi:MAG: hypothetical protein KAJ19_20710, partial [Gammaproteobacteria bacterium]|nr:hypothetical protein [Gammaproteobacteria bacterium]